MSVTQFLLVLFSSAFCTRFLSFEQFKRHSCTLGKMLNTVILYARCVSAVRIKSCSVKMHINSHIYTQRYMLTSVYGCAQAHLRRFGNHVATFVCVSMWLHRVCNCNYCRYTRILFTCQFPYPLSVCSAQTYAHKCIANINATQSPAFFTSAFTALFVL